MSGVTVRPVSETFRLRNGLIWTSLLLGAALGLAACGGAPPEDVDNDRLQTGASMSPAQPGSQAFAATRPRIPPASLKGLDPVSVVALLGEPGLLRRDPPAEIWQYHGVGCVVDLFLYEDNFVRRVTFVQVRPLDNDGDRVDETACLSRLAHPRSTTPAGGSHPAL